MKKLWGSTVFGVAKVVDAIFKGLIFVTGGIVSIGQTIKSILIPIVLLLVFLAFLNPFLLIMAGSILIPSAIVLILVFIIPFIGNIAVSSLKYYKYTVTEFLYDYADFYRLSKGTKTSYKEYGNRYRREQEEKRRKEQEERQRADNARWEKIFEEFFRSQQGYNQGGYQGGYGRGYQGGYSANPYDDFKSKYQKACDTLGVSYDTDIYEVKLNYRKLAKQFHPDINKDPGASDKFKEISQAYEFLSEQNIERYKRMKNV